MRQAVMTKPGHIEINDVPFEFDLRSNEIVLQIKKIGVCGSDIHVYHGEHPATPYPVIQGHEYAGVVHSIGSNVKSVKVGQKATARPQLVCNQCNPCKRGHYNVCQKLRVQGFQAPGTAQDFFVVSEDRLIVLPDQFSFEQGAMVEPTAVGAHATNRTSKIEGKNVVVSGAGTIGNLVAQFAKVRGAKKVLITDVSNYRLEIAKECGIDGVLNVAETSFSHGVKDFFGDEGFQVGMEAAGVQPSLDVLIENVEKGGDVVIIGVFSENPKVNMYFLGEHELNVLGSMMYKHEDYEEAVDKIAKGQIRLEPLMSKHFDFKNFIDAYHYIDKQGEKSMKVFIDF